MPASVSPPPTLLELSGVSPRPARLAESVVVLIDAQRVYVDGRLPLPGIHAALAEAARLLARARATRDLPDGHGGVVPAEVVQRANLAALADRFATVVETSDEIPD